MIKSRSNLKSKGRYRIFTYPAGNGTRAERLAAIKSGKVKPARVSAFIDNLIMLGTNTGLNIVLQQLGGQTAYPIAIDSASIGTDDTAPTDADTDLIAAVTENIAKATTTINSGELILEFFITNDELADGTYKEFGLFCGTQIFARSIITPNYTKASNEDSLIEYTINAANA